MPSSPDRSQRLQKEALLVDAALASSDYRSFIRNVLQASSPAGKRPNMAALTRKAGFSARSFIGDVLDGRRRLSPNSYPKLARALPLPARLRSYFHLLVIREEDEINHEKLKPDVIENRLNEMRARLRTQTEDAENNRETATIVLRGLNMMECYAALGSANIGANSETVSARTGLTKDFVESVLKYLVEKKVIRQEGDRYYPSNPMYLFKDLGKEEGPKLCYQQSLDELRRKANTKFESDERAFFQFVYSVDRAKMPAFKQRLWDLMQEFMEESESPEGDSVAKLILGFYT